MNIFNKIWNLRKLKKELEESRFLKSYYLSENGSTFYYDFIGVENTCEPNILKVIGRAHSLSYEEQLKYIKKHWEKTLEEVLILRKIMEELELTELPLAYNFETPEYLLEFERIPDEFVKKFKMKNKI